MAYWAGTAIGFEKMWVRQGAARGIERRFGVKSRWTI
jgi:hypothetical protein